MVDLEVEKTAITSECDIEQCRVWVMKVMGKYRSKYVIDESFVFCSGRYAIQV